LEQNTKVSQYELGKTTSEPTKANFYLKISRSKAPENELLEQRDFEK